MRSNYFEMSKAYQPRSKSEHKFCSQDAKKHPLYEEEPVERNSTVGIPGNYGGLTVLSGKSSFSRRGNIKRNSDCYSLDFAPTSLRIRLFL